MFWEWGRIFALLANFGMDFAEMIVTYRGIPRARTVIEREHC